MDIWDGFAGALIGAIIGGWVAGYFSRRATKDLLDGERLKREADDRNQAKALLELLFAEVDSVWRDYLETSGNNVEAVPLGQPIRLYVPIIADYFPVYHGNVQFLGLIKDVNLRSQIIAGYGIAKGLVDTLKLNNQLNAQRDHALDQVFLNNTKQTQDVLKIKEQMLSAYAPMVKLAHQRAKNVAQTLLPAMSAALKS